MRTNSFFWYATILRYVPCIPQLLLKLLHIGCIAWHLAPQDFSRICEWKRILGTAPEPAIACGWFSTAWAQTRLIPARWAKYIPLLSYHEIFNALYFVYPRMVRNPKHAGICTNNAWFNLETKLHNVNTANMSGTTSPASINLMLKSVPISIFEHWSILRSNAFPVPWLSTEVTNTNAIPMAYGPLFQVM